MKRRLILLTAALLLGACQQGGEPSVPAGPFHYDLTSSSSLDLESHTATGPLSGVLVSVRTAPASPTLPGVLLWMGVTGADGHARAAFRTDRAGGAPLDIVLQKAGFQGPYTDEPLRTTQGIFAPSARLAVPLDQMGAVSVALVQKS